MEKVAYVTLETTGLNPLITEITNIQAMKSDGTNIDLDIQVKGDNPEFIYRHNGLSPEYLEKHGMLPRDAARQLSEFLQDVDEICVYHANFAKEHLTEFMYRSLRENEDRDCRMNFVNPNSKHFVSTKGLMQEISRLSEVEKSNIHRTGRAGLGNDYFLLTGKKLPDNAPATKMNALIEMDKEIELDDIMSQIQITYSLKDHENAYHLIDTGIEKNGKTVYAEAILVDSSQEPKPLLDVVEDLEDTYSSLWGTNIARLEIVSRIADTHKELLDSFLEEIQDNHSEELGE